MTPEEREAWLKEQREWEEQALVRYGYYVHYVPLSEDYANAHTHGIAEAHPGQLDLQIVMRIPTGLAGKVFQDLYERIAAGERFGPGERLEGVLNGLPVLTAEALEGYDEPRRKVLRLILPCTQGTLPGEPDHPADFCPLQYSLDTEHPPWEEDE